MSAMPVEDQRVPPSAPDPESSLVECPCCRYRTLDERANFEICVECGWEDDGQGDEDAHIVRGGPNGQLSLAQARLEYVAAAEEPLDESSVTHGGEGLWWAAAQEQLRNEPH
ncbi:MULTISPECIES: CPCC family cysteine-rich protein [Streptomyces]|nr:CPCC family cysteine-rich protein [Streptomyces turgidiscabies]